MIILYHGQTQDNTEKFATGHNTCEMPGGIAPAKHLTLLLYHGQWRENTEKFPGHSTQTQCSWVRGPPFEDPVKPLTYLLYHGHSRIDTEKFTGQFGAARARPRVRGSANLGAGAGRDGPGTWPARPGREAPLFGPKLPLFGLPRLSGAHFLVKSGLWRAPEGPLSSTPRRCASDRVSDARSKALRGSP